jgi:heme-degrading monooxygenase HmoA
VPISMTNHAPGMPAAAYDDAMAHVGEALRRSEGFISHAAQVTAEGVTVTEVWESREQWRQWFDVSVKPHLPPNAPEPTVVELHNVLHP